MFCLARLQLCYRWVEDRLLQHSNRHDAAVTSEASQPRGSACEYDVDSCNHVKIFTTQSLSSVQACSAAPGNSVDAGSVLATPSSRKSLVRNALCHGCWRPCPQHLADFKSFSIAKWCRFVFAVLVYVFGVLVYVDTLPFPSVVVSTVNPARDPGLAAVKQGPQSTFQV